MKRTLLSYGAEVWYGVENLDITERVRLQFAKEF